MSEEEQLQEIIFKNKHAYLNEYDVDFLLDLYNKEKQKNKEYKNALVDIVNQFADTDKEEKYLYTMGLSALENAFNILNIDEGIRREDLWKKKE